jgi:hypothetical protein
MLLHMVRTKDATARRREQNDARFSGETAGLDSALTRQPSRGVRRGIEIQKAIVERRGDDLVRAIAEYLRAEKVDVSDAALLALTSAVHAVRAGKS